MEIIVNIVRPNYITNAILLDELNHSFFSSYWYTNKWKLFGTVQTEIKDFDFV